MTERLNVRRMDVPGSSISEHIWFDAERDITPNDWENINHELESLRKDGDWEHFVPMAARIQLLDPKRTVPITGSEWEVMYAKKAEVAMKTWMLDFDYVSSLKVLRPYSPVFAADRNEYEKEVVRRKDMARKNHRDG